jgi:phospholipid/cholesterol/gamma-HCH transport system substrate-binding protein
MEQSKNMEIKVGALVAVGVALFVTSVILLGSDTAFFKSTYNLKVEYDNVQGLGPGSIVQLLGIPVGNITRIVITEREGKHRLEVNLNIDKEYQKRITEGSVAGVRTQGALGDKYIFIIAGPPDGKPIPHDGYIAAEQKADFFDTIADNSGKIEKLFQAIEEAHKLLANLNGNGKSAELMHNLVAVSEEMKKAVADLRGGDGADSKLRQSLTHLASVMEKIDNGKGTLGALINDKSVFENIKRMLGGSEKEKYMKGLIRETIQTGEK